MHNPISLVLRALGLLLEGKLLFRRHLAREWLDDGGELFRAFRRVEVEPSASRSSTPGAIFQVRFRFKNLSSEVNQWLSLIPIPLIVAQPGFRSKTWLLGERSGEFVGHYEFDSLEQAEAYWDSLPMRIMRKRAAPGLRHSALEAPGRCDNEKAHRSRASRRGLGQGRPNHSLVLPV